MASDKSDARKKKKTGETPVAKGSEQKVKTGTSARKKKDATSPEAGQNGAPVVEKKLSQKTYETELARLQIELFKLQEWVVRESRRVVIIFEGRDAAGKGSAIARITESLNPRVCRVVALSKPTERERTQWYFQRYVTHLPSAGEIVIFDRSWYNRAGVERVMEFCTEQEYVDFLRACPEFERLLVYSGINLIKYWFSVSSEEQEKRFKDRIQSPTKRWKFSEIDLQSYLKWDDYSRAKDEMFLYTNIKRAPWYVVNSDKKRSARLNCITHLLSLFPYTYEKPESIELPSRKVDVGYIRPPLEDQPLIPEIY